MHKISPIGVEPAVEDTRQDIGGVLLSQSSLHGRRALPRLRPDVSAAEIRAYLRTTARSVLADVWRQRHGTVLMEFDDQRDAAPPVEREHDVDVSPILDGLPANYRSVLELRFLRGYSIRETAAAMGVSVANAKVLQLRALRRAAATGVAYVEG